MYKIRDIDILQLIRYSYMDLSDKKNYLGYKKDVEILIKDRAKIWETDRFILDREIKETASVSAMFDDNNQHIMFNFKKNIELIKKNENLNGLVLIGHINDDVMPGNENGTGLVAYAFKYSKGNEIIFLCRGSEGGIFSFVPDWVDKIKQRKWTEIFKSEDWRDNFNMIFKDSTNFKPLREFANEIMHSFGDGETKYKVFGHSKGGGLAIYLAALFDDMEGVSVDGVGLPVTTFIDNINFILNLKKSKLYNMVGDNDIVGKMLVHFEKREYVKLKDSFLNENNERVNPNEIYAFNWAHYPDAIYIDDNGMTEISRNMRFLPTAVGVINSMLMILILYDKLSDKHKKEYNELLDTLKDKSIKILEGLSV